MATKKGEKQRNLRDFLRHSFRPDEFEMFLRDNDYPEVAHAVARSVAGEEYFFSVIQALDHRGLINGAFFDSLAAARPRKADRIRGLRGAWFDDGIHAEMAGTQPQTSVTPYEAHSQAERLIEQAGRTGALSLELRGLGLERLPESIRPLWQIRWLDLRNNRLSSVPDSIGQLGELQELYINGNQLMSVPEWLGQLGQLTVLSLGTNQLSSIPASLGHLDQLKRLYAGSNELSSIPESLGELKQLQNLHLDRNRLSSIPETIGQLTALELLDLSDNQLTSLPSSLTSLSQLKGLFLHGNESLGIPARFSGQPTRMWPIKG